MTSPFFLFEADFVDSLRCIPMAVRMQLDISGIKLKLNEWSKLSQAQRQALVQMPFATHQELESYRSFLSNLIESICGARPSMLSEIPNPAWDDATMIPAQVLDQANALTMKVPLSAWAALTPLQRFALIKLSRPGHENRNFPAAMTEFGLHPIVA